MIEQFSSKLSPWPTLIHNAPILEFCLSFLFCVSKHLISNIGNSSGHPIVPPDPSVSFCWKSTSSSSPEFLAGNPFTASFPSVLAEIDLPSRKFGSLSSLTQRPSSLKTKCCLYGITYKVPSQSERLTLFFWKPDFPSAHSSLLEICPLFRPVFIAGNPFALPLILHYWKSVCSSA